MSDVFALQKIIDNEAALQTPRRLIENSSIKLPRKGVRSEDHFHVWVGTAASGWVLPRLGGYFHVWVGTATSGWVLPRLGAKLSCVGLYFFISFTPKVRRKEKLCIVCVETGVGRPLEFSESAHTAQRDTCTRARARSMRKHSCCCRWPWTRRSRTVAAAASAGRTPTRAWMPYAPRYS